MNIARAAASLALLALGPLTLAACGAGAAFPQKEAAPTNPDEALAMLDRAEGDLRLALGPAASPAVGAPAASAAPVAPGVAEPAADQARPSSPPPPPAAPPSRDAEERETKVSAGDDAKSAPYDPCVSACRALGSMTRAATHLCSLAGDGDARCASAQDRVKSATTRVQQACPACAADGG
jgi:hypothetical protein